MFGIICFRSAEVDSGVSEHGSGNVISDSKTDAEKDSDIMKLNGVDIHQDAVNNDMMLNYCIALGDQHIASGETEAPETEGGRLPRSAMTRKHYECGQCGRICSSLAELREHSSVSHGIKPSERANKIQLRLSRRSLSRKHPSCWICGRVCSSLTVLKGHFVLKHPAEDQSILSDEKLLRSKAFLHRNNVNGFQSEVKHAGRCHPCAVCGKGLYYSIMQNSFSIQYNIEQKVVH